MENENGDTYFKEYWENPPQQLTELQMAMSKINGERRRAAYIEKHPMEKSSPAPTGWDEPMQPKKRRRRK